MPGLLMYVKECVFVLQSDITALISNRDGVSGILRQWHINFPLEQVPVREFANKQEKIHRKAAEAVGPGGLIAAK